MINTKDNYVLYAMGTRGSIPIDGKQFEIFGGQTTCFIIKHKKHAVVVDCGTGLYDAERILSDCDLIDVVFTHVHYDHVLGLLDLSIFPKNARINFMGTFKLWLQYDTFNNFYRHPFWPIQPKVGIACEIENDGTPYKLSDDMELRAYDSSHPDAGNIIILNINNKKVCFMFDIESTEKLNLEIINGCDVLIYDGMYDDGEYNQHIGWGHSTFQEGCRLANVYNCKKLLITHHAPKKTDEELLEYEVKAKTIFAKTRFCRAGDIFTI